MATPPSTDGRRRARTPFLTIVIVAAIAAGFAIGVQSLRTATNAGGAAEARNPTAAPATLVRIPDLGAERGGENRVTHPVPTPAVPLEACKAMDPTAYGAYCAPAKRSPVTAPKATWQACEAMDPTTYAQYCRQGDGGRWITGS